MSFLISEAAAPSTPASNKVAVYAKTDGRVYGKDDAGTEFNMSGIVSGTAVTASGATIDFTSIPSWVKKITVLFSSISTNGTSNTLIQLGTASGVETTGYLGSSTQLANTATVTGSNLSTGFITDSAANNAASRHSVLTMYLLTGNTWVASGISGRSDTIATQTLGGTKALSGTLDRVRITTVNGTDTFDAGTVNILYE